MRLQTDRGSQQKERVIRNKRDRRNVILKVLDGAVCAFPSFPECVAKGSISKWGSGCGIVFDSFSARVRRTSVSVRERSWTSAACSLRCGYRALQLSVSRARRLVRLYGRFAWQAWGIVAAYARRWVEGWRFAWQAWGMVDDVCVKRLADVHLAWEAWRSGCMSAFGQALEGGPA